MISRILCALLGHPWLEVKNDYDAKCCPCGKSAISASRLIAAWPGEDPWRR